jgi:4-hydroxy-3-polyprenylbenzoate decarboxylase
VSFNKQYPQQAHKVINALWSLPQLMSTKIVVAVDGDVDVRNEDQVWFQMGANVYPGRDTFVSNGPADMSDHSAPVRGMGAKLGIDATRKLNTEGHLRDWPEELKMTHNIEQLVRDRWTEYGIEL